MVVGCIIEKDNGIMLCRRGIEPRKGLWNLPCGFLENEETVQQGAKREVFEETGATVHLHNLHVVYNLPHANQVYLIFKATLENDATWHTTPESTEVEFFSLKDIPWNDIAFSSNSFAIQHLIKQKAGETHEPLAIGSFFKNKIR
jgi:ADP-ribose pyrophosphatase YjhB (NUDIX family)